MSDENVLSIGLVLKNKRKELGLTLDDIEHETFINKKYLTALEEESWEELPGYPYAYGYVKSYGKVLNLDQENLKAIFQRSYPHPPKKELSRKPHPDYAPVKTSLFKKILVFLVITAVFFTTLYLSIEFRKDGPLQRTEQNPTLGTTSTPIIESRATPTSETSPLVVQAFTPSPSPSPDYPLQVMLKTDEVAWLQVITSENQKVFSGIVVPQKEYVFMSTNPLIISSLNGTKIEVSLNGENVGYLAESDQREERIFRP